MERERLVTLIGPSGGGKSSLIGAGLLPVLADRGGWRFIRIRLGVDPFDALAGALLPPGLTTAQRVEERRRLNALLIEGSAGVMAVLREWSADAPGTRLLLIVDQCEELFTNAQAGDPARARAFAVALGALAAADPAAGVGAPAARPAGGFHGPRDGRTHGSLHRPGAPVSGRPPGHG